MIRSPKERDSARGALATYGRADVRVMAALEVCRTLDDLREALHGVRQQLEIIDETMRSLDGARKPRP